MSFVFTGSSTANEQSSIVDATIEDWVAGSILGENSLFVYLDNVTQPEFIEYSNLNNISGFTISVFWRDDASLEFTQIGSDIIQDISAGFNVDSWSFTVDGNYNIDPNITPEPGSYGVLLPGTYFFQVIYNNEICGAMLELPVLEDIVEEEEEELPIELPTYVCGESFTPEPISNNVAAPFSTNDIIFIGGFPILVQEEGANGSGIIPLPFDNKVVSISFNNIQVNSEGVVFSGSVSANSDSPGSYPNFNLVSEPLNIGGDICLPEPPAPGYDSEGVNGVTGLDERGFDPETGLFSDGSEYDGNGFDIDGNHMETGGPYNDQGCNYLGFDSNGNQCDPTAGPYAPAGDYAESVSESLENEIPGVITTLKNEIEAELNQLNCNGIRSEMDVLILDLQYTRDFVFGDADRYFKKGMHLNFKEKPKKLVLNIERVAKAKELEEKHIDLFDCDKKEYAFEAIIVAIDEMVNDIGYNEILNDIKAAISNWSEYQYNLYTNDPAKFNEWLTSQIGIILQEKSGLDDSYTAQDTPRQSLDRYEQSQKSMHSIFDFNRSSNLITNAIASTDNSFLLNDEFTLDDASFLYLQGEKQINGFDRALFMEEIGLQRMLTVSETNQTLTPIVVTKTVANKTYSIYLDNIKFNLTGATLDAHAVIEDPESGKKLIFSSTDLSFGPTGLTSDARLFLSTDIEVRLNNAAMFILKGTEDTYVEWDCEGFKSMGIDAEIEFCRNFITPLDPVSLEPLPEEERYRLEFKIEEISSWLEFSLELDAEPFAITQFTDVKWELTQMIVDMSSTYTPTFTPLQGYTSPFWDDDANVMSPCWKGFYMNTLSATFPNSFSSSEEKITATANDILIDGSGFTGSVEVEDLINIDDGDMGGWPFSISSFELVVLKNQFAGAGFGGEIEVSIFEEPMDYQAVMYPENNYKFTVSPNESVTMDMFLATGEIYEDSKIEVAYDDEGFHTVATLNGKFTASTGGEESTFDIALPSMCFQDFRVSNRAPYFDAGTWGLVSASENGGEVSASFNGFDIKVSGLQPYSDGDNIAGIDLNIDVVVSNKIDVAAGGGFGIEGELILDAKNRQQWVYKRIDVKSFDVDATFPSGYVKGELEWFGDEENPDPVWGKGFRGAVAAGFEALDGMQLMAAAQFGKKEDFKYFYIDALLDLGAASIPLGPLSLKGFGGGLSYHMDTEQVNNTATSATEFTLPPIGGSFSNTVYSVDKTKGLGMKATALIATAAVESVFNGSVSLSFLFHEGGGMDKIELTGSGQFLADINLDLPPAFTEGAEQAPAGAASLSCFVNLTYNFGQPSFDGTLQTFLNSSFINGAGTGGKMVDATMHFDPEQWYIYIGKPGVGERCGIVVDLGLGSGPGISATAYLDVGTNVPPMAELPDEVKEIAYLVNTNESLRSSGQGFVFGAALEINLKASIAGLLEASLNGKAGFDVMIRRYEGYSCAGSSDEVGINGWYGSGQLYVFVSGKLKVAGATVAELALATVLQARLPNPFWAQATVGVKIKAGLLDETFSMKLELGDDCTLVSSLPNPELGIDVILSLDPTEGVQNVETNIIPKAFFAVPLGEDLSVPDINGVNVVYRAELLSATLVSQEGFDLSGKIEFNDNKTQLAFVPDDLLLSNNELTFNVEVRIYKNGNFLSDEDKAVNFTSGDIIGYIPEENIHSAYPINGMANFHKNEYNQYQGYLYLKSGQPDLLVYLPDGYVNAIRLTASSGDVEYLDMEYDIIQRKISYSLDPTIMENEEVYSLEILRIKESLLASLSGSSASGPSTSGTASTGASTAGPTAFTAFSYEETSPPPPPSSSSAQTYSGETQNLIESLYKMYFRVSKYDTFKAKLNAISATESGMLKDLSNYEIFGSVELNGIRTTNKFVTIKPNLNINYVNQEVKPILESLEIYDCTGNRMKTLSDLEKEKHVVFSTHKAITKTNFEDTQFTFSAANPKMHLIYNLSLKAFVRRNYNIRNECGIFANVFETASFECNSNSVPPEEREVACNYLEGLLEIESAFGNMPALYPGSYSLDFIYKIPNRSGGLTTTSEKVTFIN